MQESRRTVGLLDPTWRGSTALAQCLFQYGCSERNQPASLSRRALHELLAGGLRLASPDPVTGEEGATDGAADESG